MPKKRLNKPKAHRKYFSYYDYVDNVVKKCSHKWLILDSKDFRSYRIAKFADPNFKESLKPGVHIKITPAKCKSYSCPICGKKKVMDLVKRLNTVNLNKYRFFTLTLKNKMNLDNTEENLKKISSYFNKLNLTLRKKPEYKGLEFFRVVEIGKDGMVHIHGIWNKYIPSAYLSELWFKITKNSFIVSVEKIKNKKDAIQYLYKYLTKDVSKTDMQINPELMNMNLLNNAAIFYETGKRRFQASRKFFPKESKKEKEFLPYYFEESDSKTVEETILSLIKNYGLKKSNFDFEYYNESDLFIDNLFFKNKGST